MLNSVTARIARWGRRLGAAARRAVAGALVRARRRCDERRDVVVEYLSALRGVTMHFARLNCRVRVYLRGGAEIDEGR
ncbi:MAG TPA: hypothetical protein VLB27_07575 [candidate division Zixibacteria bacterium]|nr:hypothetical protein [candidate division Zixibacteria bacterium]